MRRKALSEEQTSELKTEGRERLSCAEPAGTASARALGQEGVWWVRAPGGSSPGSWWWGPVQVDVRGRQEKIQKSRKT